MSTCDKLTGKLTLGATMSGGLLVAKGEKGDKGDKGDAYVITDADKQEIKESLSGDIRELKSDLVDLENTTVNTIESTNKFDTSIGTHEYYLSTGDILQNDYFLLSDFIEIPNGATKVIACAKYGSSVFTFQYGGAVFFDANKSFISGSKTTEGLNPINISSNYKYVRVWFNTNLTQMYVGFSNVDNPTVPTYEEYFESYLVRKPLDNDSVAENMLTSDVRAKLNSGGGSSSEYVPFAGKKIVGVGDSIMVGINSNGTAIVDGKKADGTPCTDQGFQINSTGGFLGELRAKYTSINVVNMGVGSTTMQRNNNVPANVSYKCIMDRIDDIPADADIVILEGGINDYFHQSNYGTTLGTYADHLYKYPVSAKYENGAYANIEWAIDVNLDVNAFCGSFEIALTKVLVRFIGKPIIYVIPHNPSANADIDTYFDSAKAICKKYGVPVVDIREVGCMPKISVIQGKTDGSSAFTYDGVHPNPLGYQKHYVPLIVSMLKSIM